MPDLNNVTNVGYAASRMGSIVADGNQTSWLQKTDKVTKYFLTRAPFTRIMRAIGKRIAGFMRMQREDALKENASLDSRKNIPNHSRRAL